MFFFLQKYTYEQHYKLAMHSLYFHVLIFMNAEKNKMTENAANNNINTEHVIVWLRKQRGQEVEVQTGSKALVSLSSKNVKVSSVNSQERVRGGEGKKKNWWREEGNRRSAAAEKCYLAGTTSTKTKADMRGEPAAEVEARKSGLELRKKDKDVGRELEFPADVGFAA